MYGTIEVSEVVAEVVLLPESKGVTDGEDLPIFMIGGTVWENEKILWCKGVVDFLVEYWEPLLGLYWEYIP